MLTCSSSKYLHIKFLLKGEVEHCPVVTSVLVLPVRHLSPQVYFTHILRLHPMDQLTELIQLTQIDVRRNEIKNFL